MKAIISENAQIGFENAYISPHEQGRLVIIGAYLTEKLPENEKGCPVCIPRLTLVPEDMTLESASEMPLKFFSVKDKKVHTSKERKLYKSELPSLEEKLFSFQSDIFSIDISPCEKGISITAELNFCEEERELYRIKIICSSLAAEWEEYGEIITPEKPTLKERAEILKRDIPAAALSIADRRTPLSAKIIAALAVAYALSPVDLIPDFIPVIGALDDLLILSGLLALAVKLIPRDVMEENRKKAREHYYKPKKRWIYGLPVVIIWIALLAVIILALMK